MSSICGLYRPDGPAVETAEIEAMVKALDYWSADARGTWTSGRAGLGHLLLSTTARSRRASLPTSDEEAGITITGDCRLDNRTDLAGRLGVGPGELGTLSDERLVLRAYRQWGEQCVAHVLGDFAFAIWDGPHRQLFCARDPFGVKPFYYYARGGLFAFATEMKGLLALPAVDRTVDETWIGDYLHLLNLDLVTTFYAGIKRLAPAHALTFGTAGARTWRYWALDPHRELRLPRESDYVEAFRGKLELAVRRRTETPFEVGAELSGGLDSAAICAIAQEDLASRGRDLQTFSQVLPEGTPERPGYPFDARWAIDLVCQQAGIRRTCFLAGEGGVLPALEWAYRHYDEPPRTLVSLDNHDLYEAAAERGVRVLLSGFGGNFGVSAAGTGRLRELVWSGRWIEVLREISAIERRPLDWLIAAMRPVLGRLEWPAAHPPDEDRGVGTAWHASDADGNRPPDRHVQANLPSHASTLRPGEPPSNGRAAHGGRARPTTRNGPRVGCRPQNGIPVSVAGRRAGRVVRGHAVACEILARSRPLPFSTKPRRPGAGRGEAVCGRAGVGESGASTSPAERCGCIEGDAGPHPGRRSRPGVSRPREARRRASRSRTAPAVRGLENMMALLLTENCVTREHPTWGGAMTSRWDAIRRFCLFVGYGRSGHSAVGALLDAHPHATVSHELHAVKRFFDGVTRDVLFDEIFALAQRQARDGRFASRAGGGSYRHNLPGRRRQTVGITLIGDKKGAGTAWQLDAGLEHMEDFKRTLECLSTSSTSSETRSTSSRPAWRGEEDFRER